MYNMQFFNMDPENAKLKKKWKKDEEKEHIRVTLLKEAADFAMDRAPEFGVGQSILSLEISKLILIAKDCLEKQNPK
jgi:hypothetical protein